MDSFGKVTLLNADGRPLDPRIQAALRDLAPRFRNRFLTLDDEIIVTEIFEEAGRRIIEYETEFGPAVNLGGYAWRILHNVAVTRLRHSSMRLKRATLPSRESQAVIGSLLSRETTAEQIEANIALEEFLTSLTPQERRLCIRKKAGYSSREIGSELGISATYVDTLFSRIKRKCRDARDRGKAGKNLSSSAIPQGRGFGQM